MSAQPLVLANNKTPANVATDFLCVIKDIEACIENSNSQAAAIENRGLFKSAFSSSRKDLVDISRSQNKINEMMLGLIQEVITLNAMSYSFLAAVIGELEDRCRNGWKDSDGQLQELSDTGRQFADRANDIFVKILDGSKSTQNKIEVNQQKIAELRDKLQLKAQMVLKHNAEIDSIKNTLSNKAVLMQKSQQDISSIQSLLEVKAERLSLLDQALEEKKQTLEQHDQAIHALIEELQENNRLDMAREQVVQDMQVQMAALSQRANHHKIFMSGLAIGCAALATITTLDLLNLL
ncbi:hypothetical protein EF096_10750 [Pseudomonas neustonica]|uniref:Uncharacterized protein n=1 Tax=Pseudomonas neustonica TaxID=2487346 RepID=A0ABX9XKC0_9PSED|nr:MULTISPECIES: hypothetical protein [Pseudomonas]ROZ84217.1 hypothetical protein EF099_07845 [Pseudomonas sp. SSM44]ROZ84464.1 hypothetical protein EF096_10750 [Pseudomonas neustonica]